MMTRALLVALPALATAVPAVAKPSAPTPGSPGTPVRQTLLDPAALVAYTYDRGGVSTSGFEYYVVVGSMLATVQVDAVPGAPQAAAETVARAVAACLKQSPCPDLPVPAGLGPA